MSTVSFYPQLMRFSQAQTGRVGRCGTSPCNRILIINASLGCQMGKSRLKNSLQMGGWCGIAGLVIGACFTGFSAGQGMFAYLWLRASLSAAMVGSGIWYFYVVKPEEHDERGITAGMAISIVGQYVCWFMLIAYPSLHNHLTNTPTDSFGGPPPGMTESLHASAWGLLLSLLSLGWLTVPIGAILGAKAAERQKEK